MNKKISQIHPKFLVLMEQGLFHQVCSVQGVLDVGTIL